MSAALFKKTEYSVVDLIEAIDKGEIGLPDIQRPFVWEAERVRDLFDSMYKGFPVGYLLFWSNEQLGKIRQIGTEPKEIKIPRLLIVDGQQRLTALYAVLKNRPVLAKDFKEQQIKLAFRPRDGRFEVSEPSLERDPDFIPDISQLWSNNTSPEKFIKPFIARLQDLRELSYDDEIMLVENIEQLYQLTTYSYTAMEIAAWADEEQVADIFVRINSSGVMLRQTDFILTLLSVFWEEGRVQLEQFSQAGRNPQSELFSPLVQPGVDDLLLVSLGIGFRRAKLADVYAILRGKDVQTGEVSAIRREKQFELLQKAQAQTLNPTAWREFQHMLHKAGFRNAEQLPAKITLLYTYALFLVGREEFNVDSYYLRDLMARWFFMATLTARYEAEAEKTMENDFNRLRRVNDAIEFVETLDQVIKDALTTDFWQITLVNNLETASVDSAWWGAYCAALVLLDAPVLFSAKKVAEWLEPNQSLVEGNGVLDNKQALFSKEYLSTMGITEGRDISQIANYTLVDWGEKVNYAKLAPSDYLPHYTKLFNEAELARMSEAHALPLDWDKQDYDGFLATRCKIMAQIIRKGYEKRFKPGLGM